MTRQDYARYAELRAAENLTAAQAVELAALQAKVGVAVVVNTRAKYDAIAAKGVAATQEELDGLRRYESAARVKVAPVVFQAPAAPLVPAAVDLSNPRMVAALQELVLLGERAALLLAELAA